MAVRWHHRVWHYLLLLAAGSLLFLWNLGGASLWDIDEGRNATCAQEMMESGNWIVPTFNGELRVDKPALLYWLQISAYYVLGVNEFAARLPSALAALGALLLAYELARLLFGKATGLLTGLVVATMPMLCGAARFANPDALLHFFTLLTLLLFWQGHRQPTRWWWIGLGAAAGMGMLAKGPVGLVLPATVAFLFLLWDGRLRVLLDWRIGWGLWTFCLVALPWYIWVGVETKGAFLRGFFLEHNAGRFGGTMEGHSGTPLYYPLVLFIGTAPWSLVLLAGIWCGLRSVGRAKTLAAGAENSWADRQQAGHPEIKPGPASAYRFLLAWIATYVLFFSLAATKLPNYVLPVIVPCAVLTARCLERWRRGLLHVPAWSWRVVFTALLLMGAGISAGLSVAGGVGNWPMLQGRFLPGLTAYAWIGVMPVLGALAARTCWRRGRRQAVLVCLIIGATATLAPMAALASAFFNSVKPARPLVELAGAWQRDADIRIGAWQMQHLPSLNFYLQRDVLHVQSETELRSLLQYPLPVYVFLPAHAWENCRPATRRLGQEVARHRDLVRHGEVVVVVNAEALQVASDK